MKSSYSSSDERGKHNNKRVNRAKSSGVFSLFWLHPLLKFNVSWLNNRNLEFMCRQTWTQQLKMIPLVSLCVANHTQELSGYFFCPDFVPDKREGWIHYIYLGKSRKHFFVSELQLNFCTLQVSGLLCSRRERKSLAAASNICAMEKGFSGFGEEGKKS